MFTDCHPAGHVRRSLSTSFLSSIALLLACGVCSAQESRTWTDSTGKFTIVGKLSSNDGKTARIEKSDGKVVAIPVDKLSKADQLFLSKAAADNPFQEEEANPFQPDAPAMEDDEEDEPAPAAGKGAANGGEPRNVNIRYNAIRNVQLVPENKEFGVEITPAATVKLRSKPTTIPPNYGFWDKLQGMEVSGNGRVLFGYDCDLKTATGHILIPVGTTDKDTRVTHFVLADAVSGKLLSQAHFIGEGYHLLGMHDDGVRFAVRTNTFGFGKSKHVEIWAFNGPKTILRGMRLAPFDDADRDPEKDIEWGEFVGDRLLVGRRGRMMAINAADGRPQYQLPVSGKPLILPDKRHAIIFHDKNLGILDIDAGKILCAMQFDSAFAPAMGVDPTGKYLVCLSQEKMTQIDLRNGDILTQFTISIGSNDPLVVLDDRYVLTGNGALCDLKNQVEVWSFSGASKIQPFGDEVLFYKSEGDEKSGVVFTEKLPGDALARHLDDVTSQPGYFCLEPGVHVRLDVEGIPDQQKRQEILASLFKKLEANGNVVDPNGEVLLKATITNKGQVERRFFGGGTATFQEYQSSLQFIYQGKTVWSRGGSNIPHIISVDRNEGLQAAADKYNKPNYYTFENVVLPNKVVKPSDSRTNGSTRVTISGLQ